MLFVTFRLRFFPPNFDIPLYDHSDLFRGSKDCRYVTNLWKEFCPAWGSNQQPLHVLKSCSLPTKLQGLGLDLFLNNKL